jgi:putative aldouronate transport system permease protein
MSIIMDQGVIDIMSRKITLKDKLYKQRYVYMLLIPGFICLVIFSYLPLGAWLMAFKDYRLGFNLLSAKWVGLKNFKTFFIDMSDSWNVIRNTIVINSISLIVILGSALLLAVLLNEVKIKWFKNIIQSSTFFPYFISWVIIYVIFSTFLSVNSGLVNILLVKAGIIKEGINFIGDESLSWPLIVFVNLWRYVGYNCIIFLAAISSIDVQQYESSDIDGANRLDKIWNITLPGISDTFFVLFIMDSGWMLSSNFEQYFLFTNTINMSTMEVLDIYIYRYGLKQLDFSYATSASIIKTVISILILVAVNAIAKKMRGKSLFYNKATL